MFEKAVQWTDKIVVKALEDRQCTKQFLIFLHLVVNPVGWLTAIGRFILLALWTLSDLYQIQHMSLSTLYLCKNFKEIILTTYNNQLLMKSEKRTI